MHRAARHRPFGAAYVLASVAFLFSSVAQAQALVAEFDTPGGNSWWVEVYVAADETLVGVDASVEGGPWQPLQHQVWGAWAASFFVADGSFVEFQARSASGATALSSPHVWPSGELAVAPPAPPSGGGGGGFSAIFVNPRGNSWWVETNIEATQAITRVDVRVDGGALVPLLATSWGSWASSFYVPPGSIVEFRAIAVTGVSVTSQRFLWPEAIPVDDTGGGGGPPPPVTSGDLEATFLGVRGNAWWIETEVLAREALVGVDARIDGGPWQALIFTDWGSWARSLFVSSGSLVELRARGVSGDVSISVPYLWPDAVPVGESPPSGGTPGTDPPSGGGGGALPDLTVDTGALERSLYFETVTFPVDSCAVQEACVSGTGTRRLLRFTTTTHNVGTVDLVIGAPEGNPAFEFSSCHNHYHFDGFAGYRLLDGAGRVVATGHKQGFCVMDATRHAANAVGAPQYDCNYQGISAGWSDTYVADLDCQWIDVTGVPRGSYVLEVEVNPEGRVAEASYSNNVARASVFVP